MASPDPRINPYRADIAAEGLRGVVKAGRYVSGRAMLVTAGTAAMRKNPQADAEQVNELRYGDCFTVYDSAAGWAWGQSGRDDYVGYVSEGALRDAAMHPTHRVKVEGTFLFPSPSIKAPPLDRLTFFTALEVARQDDRFAELKSGGYVHMHHITPIDQWQERDIVFTAGRMLDVPYFWGGVTPLGLDCSGLVQLALNAGGRSCPRDSDMQAAALGRVMGESPETVKLQRGDLIFFPGHVGIMVDTSMLLHANAWHGRVVVEPLADVVARGSKVTSVNRLG